MTRCYVLVLCVMTSLAGCGFTVPSIQEGWQGPDGTKELEFEIKRSVYCALRRAIQLVDKSVQYYGIDPKTHQYVLEPFLPGNWGVQICLIIQVDEVTAFNPGIGITEPFSNVVTVFKNGNVTTPRSLFLEWALLFPLHQRELINSTHFIQLIFATRNSTVDLY